MLLEIACGNATNGAPCICVDGLTFVIVVVPCEVVITADGAFPAVRVFLR